MRSHDAAPVCTNGIEIVSRVAGAVLLISSTTIGAGMLALPITTGQAGFFPSLLLMVGVWLFMLCTAFYFLEVNLRLPQGSNLISMMKYTVGPLGQLVAWAVYLILLYALLSAYFVGCSDILSYWMHLPSPGWPLILCGIFAPCLLCSTKSIDRWNRILMMGLILAYFATLATGFTAIQPRLLTYVSWAHLLPSLSIVMTTFGYHIIIPTLVTYLERDVRKLKVSIVWGSLIPLLVYVAWQLLVMGTVPVHGEVSLCRASEEGLQISSCLQQMTQSRWLLVAMQSFSFFAIVTSILAISMALSDFLYDGLRLKRTIHGKSITLLLTFIPPLGFTLFYPHGFVLALHYAGILVAILLMIFPLILVWYARYRPQKILTPSLFRVFGGKPLLIILFIVAVVALGLEWS